MAVVRRLKFATVAMLVQTAFILIFAFLAEYEASAKTDANSSAFPEQRMYPYFQDVHVMIFVGFGFLMTYLKNYGYTAVGINMFISCVAIQWAHIIRGFLHYDVTSGEKFKIHLAEMLTGDFAAAAVLISFGAVLGKASPLQLLIMTLIEVVLMQVNEYVGLDKLHAVDVGESMYIHAFGAYFGLGASLALYKKKGILDNEKAESVYHSDHFSFIGTLFLWMFWPSFNGGGAVGDEQHRALLNTYLSLTACTVTTFAFSALYDKRGRFTMEHIQNATLAGGVAVGTTANMPLEPWGALVMGVAAGILSVTGYRFITGFLGKKLCITDTCGVHNLHGMPGVLAGIAGAVMAAMSTQDKWNQSLYEIFPAMVSENQTDVDALNTKYSAAFEVGNGRTPGQQGAYQIAALGVTLGIAIGGGIITGLIMRIPILDNPEEFFEDSTFWTVPEGYGEEGEETKGAGGAYEMQSDPSQVRQRVKDDNNGTVNIHL